VASLFDFASASTTVSGIYKAGYLRRILSNISIVPSTQGLSLLEIYIFIAFISRYLMSRTMSSFFPTSPASPNAFSIFAQSPREAHATYEDLRRVLRPSNGAAAPKPTSPPISSKFTLFTPSQPPRDTDATCHNLHEVCPSNGQICTKKSHSRKIRNRF
jgi:hypothetical protein